MERREPDHRLTWLQTVVSAVGSRFQTKARHSMDRSMVIQSALPRRSHSLRGRKIQIRPMGFSMSAVLWRLYGTRSKVCMVDCSQQATGPSSSSVAGLSVEPLPFLPQRAQALGHHQRHAPVHLDRVPVQRYRRDQQEHAD